VTEFHQRRPLFVLLGASAISQAGNSLTALAIPWYVLETTGSAARAGVVAFAGLVPMVLASFFGGAVVDLLGFKRASILSDLASGLTVAAIPLLAVTIGLQFWHLLLLTFLGALLDAPGTTARMSLTPDLARLAAMPLARMNALAQSTSGSVSLLGPILAGVLVVAVGPRDVLWLDAASFAVSAALVAIAVPTAKREIVDGESRSVDLLGGLRYLLADRLVLAIALTATVVNFLAAPLFSVILPVYARVTFGAATDLGLLIGGFGGGTIAGSVLYGAVGPRLPRRDSLIAGFLLLGLPLFLLAIEPPLWVALLALVISGAGAGVINPLAITVLQERIPEAIRGRVFGAFMAAVLVAAPLGVLLAGFLSEIVGVRACLVGISTALVLVALSMLANPALRELDTALRTDSFAPEPGAD